MATGDEPLPLHSPPLCHSGGGLNATSFSPFTFTTVASTFRTHSSQPPKQQPRAGSVGGDGTSGGSRLAPAHLLPVQHRFRPVERNTLPTQRTPLPGTTPPSNTAPGELGVFSGRPPGRPQ